MAAGNQGSDHLVLHALDAYLLHPPGRAERRPIGEGGVGGRRGGGAFAGGGEGRAVGGDPVGVEGPGRPERPSVNTLGLRVLQGLGPRKGWREAWGARLAGLQRSTEAVCRQPQL